MCRYLVERQFEICLGLLARHGRKTIEKSVQRLAGLQVVYQRLNRYARAFENERAANDVWVSGNDLFEVHCERIGDDHATSAGYW